MYCLINIIAIAKSTGRDGWDIQLAREHDKCITNLVGKPEGKRPTAKPGEKGRIIKCILKRQSVKVSTGYIWLRIGTKHANMVIYFWVQKERRIS